ncbi:MAG: hypothetical protein ACXWQO_18125 [Bdellovibrionota bacterium]
MADRQLSLNQQLALLPVAVSDSVLDFLEDFNYGSAFETETAQLSLDPEYWKKSGDSLKKEMEALRKEMGKLEGVLVDQGGREIPGAYLLKLTFEKGARGLALLTKMKEKTIFRVLLQPGEYNEAGLKELAKNPPKAG